MDSIWTLTPGWEVRAGPERTSSETTAGNSHVCLGTVLDSLGQTLGFTLNDVSLSPASLTGPQAHQREAPRAACGCACHSEEV